MSKKIENNNFDDNKESNWYDVDYQPSPIDWKKTGIISGIIILIVTSLVLIWGFGVGGFEYSALRSYAKGAYITMNHERNLSFCENSENFDWKYESIGGGKGLKSPQEVCKENVNFMNRNNLKQSKKIKIGLGPEGKISRANYQLAIKDLKWDIEHPDYLTKDNSGNQNKDKLLMEVTLVEIEKINGKYKIVQLMNNFETREDYCKRVGTCRNI